MKQNNMQYHSGFVTIVGRPNVGKSTLLNYITGMKIAIVSHKPQTTRNRIRAMVFFMDSFPPVLFLQLKKFLTESTTKVEFKQKTESLSDFVKYMADAIKLPL